MIRARGFLAAGALALVAAGALAQGERRGGRGSMGRSANPSAVVAAELGFNQLAQSAGQWTAFRKTADKDAVMFVPQPVNAQAWLKGRADPPRAVKWSPQRIYMACDGSYAASTGSWTQPDGSTGTFTTLWRRDEKKGGFKWLLDHGDARAVPRPEEDAIEAKVGDCARHRPDDELRHGAKPPKHAAIRIPNPPPARAEGRSDDGTLRWRWDVAADGARTVQVFLRREGAERLVIDDKVRAER